MGQCARYVNKGRSFGAVVVAHCQTDEEGKCANRSSSLPSRSMNPYPLALLNHFTFPVATVKTPPFREFALGPRKAANTGFSLVNSLSTFFAAESSPKMADPTGNMRDTGIPVIASQSADSSSAGSYHAH